MLCMGEVAGKGRWAKKRAKKHSSVAHIALQQGIKAMGLWDANWEVHKG